MLNLQSGLIFNWILTETSCFLKHGLSLTVCVGTQPFFLFFIFFKQSVVFIRFGKFNITRYYISLQLSLFFSFFGPSGWKRSQTEHKHLLFQVFLHKKADRFKKKKRVDFLWQTKNQEHAHNPEACTSTIIHLNIKYTASHALTSQHQTDLTDASDDVMDKKPCS